MAQDAVFYLTHICEEPPGKRRKISFSTCFDPNFVLSFHPNIVLIQPATFYDNYLVSEIHGQVMN
jgi:hypothetical protein